MIKMEFKGTKGTWWNPQYESYIIAMPSQIKIARVYSVSVDPDQKDMQANARLISASPDLLNALQLCLNLLKEGYIDADVSPTIKIAENAISKALNN